MADINVALRGSNISLDNVYITSGSVGTVSCNFTFDSAWDGYFKTAVFYQNPKAVRYVLLDTTLTKCIVPREALKLSKPLYIGVFGTKGLDIMTSGIASVDVAAGSYLSGSVPPEPAPDVYTQILGLVEQYRNDNAAAAAAALVSENTAAQHALDAWEASGAANSAYSAIVTEESERAAAEEIRLSAESSRTGAEASRVSAESARVTAETGRASAETARAGAESARVTAETARATAETTRAANYATFSTGIADNTSSIKNLEEQLIGLNPNGESRVSVSSYAKSVTLPKNAAQGGLKTTVKGMTLTNQVVNGNFANGATGWLGYACTLSLSNSVLSVTGDGAASYPYTHQVTPLIYTSGKKIYFRMRARVTNSTCVSLQIKARGSATQGTEMLALSTAPTQNQWYIGSGVFTMDAVGTGYLRLMCTSNYADAATASGKVMEMADAVLLDLTALGLESLTKAQLDYMTDLYFDGTKHVIAPRFRSVGKNQFDGNLRAVGSGKYIKDGDNYTVTAIWYSYVLIPIFSDGKLKPNTSYNISFTYSYISGASTGNCLYYNGEISSKGLVSGRNNVTITTDATGKNSVTFRNSGGTSATFKISDIMIVEGSTASTFELYKESLLYCEPKILRRTAAGVYDEISGGNFIKRVGDDGVALATPVITENVTSGTLISYPSGTVYAEPAIGDAGVYGTNMSIFYTGYPIKTLESIRKINFTTGEETSLDVSLAVIAGNGLSFTHSGLASGDIVFFTYLYDVQRVGGENTYSYLDSRHVLADTVNGKYYTYKPVITNGAIASWVLTEVL